MMATHPNEDWQEDGERIDAATLETCRAALRAFVARRVRDAQEVEDLVQEACARLLASARSRTVDEPQAYLFRIAGNLIADRHRRQRPHEPLDETHVLPVRAAQEDGRRVRDLQSQLQAALAELSPRCAQVFVMIRFDELTSGAVAFQLGISPRMVQKYLVQATTHLYTRLGALREGRR